MGHYYKIPKRRLYYCPAVAGAEPTNYNDAEDMIPVNTEAEANLIGSKVVGQGGTKHAPVIDIDYPVTVLPSSQLGRYHLYLHKEIPWQEYKNVLHALAEAGLVEQGYVDASINKGQSAVRPPHIKKIDSPKGVEVLRENSMLLRENFELRHERDYLLQRVAELENGLGDTSQTVLDPPVEGVDSDWDLPSPSWADELF